MQVDWITMTTLGTFSGAVLAVTVLVQFLKSPIDHLAKFPTRLLALLFSWALLVAYRHFSGGITIDGLFLDFLNGFLVALSAMGTHQVARDNLNWK